MSNSDIPTEFTANYYNVSYFVTVNGKRFRQADGKESGWGYSNLTGEWHGCGPICNTWKDIFGLSGDSRTLDAGCGRGTFVTYMRDIGIKAEGFDFSGWAVQNPYVRCNRDWLRNYDATLVWPYSDNSFDLVTVLDMFEHLYELDINFVINEMFRVGKKWIFLQIATVGGGSGSGIHDNGYILRRGEKVPIELEGCAVAGHVTVQPKGFWVDKLEGVAELRGEKWIFRDDLVAKFIKDVPADVISNWVKNTLIILEKV